MSLAEETQEILRLSGSMAKTLEAMNKRQSKEREGKERNISSAAAKPANFKRLKKELGCPAEVYMLERQHNLEIASVDGIFDWIESDESLMSFEVEASPLLHVTEASGMGKSTPGFKMFRTPKKICIHEPNTCVASFYFDEEHSETKSVMDMIRWCAVKVVEQDENYCKKALVELGQGDYEENDVVWEKLIAAKYGKDSDRRLVRILDGLEAIEDEEFEELLRYFGEIKSRDLNVQIVITSDTSKVSALSSLEPQCIDIVKSKVGRDIRRLVWHRTRTQPRLQRLRVDLRRLIICKVAKQADCE